MKATHKKTKQMVGMQVVDLEPGQFVFGRKAAAKELKISEQTIRTCVQKLKTLQNLTIHATNKFSVISIINWEAYQQEDQQTNQQTNQQLTSNQPAANHKQEHKNIRKNIYTSNFLKFWEAYPKKSGKGAAFKSYQNIKSPRPSLQEILQAIAAQSKTEQWKNKQYIPNPATWLNQRRWEDEVDSNVISLAKPQPTEKERHDMIKEAFL